MQLLGKLGQRDIAERLAGDGIPLQVGPYIYNIQTNLPTVSAGISTLYRDYRLADPDEFIDYAVGIRGGGPLSMLGGRARFLFDNTSPFDTIPIGQAYAFLEWGMNWCVSLHANEYLKLHAAAVSRDDCAIIMPGIPGAGKSTLCAALGLSGWRILSDEHAMIPPATTQVIPLCRPVSLKNESIKAIQDFSAQAILGPTSRETHKGVVAHMKADLHPDSHNGNSPQARCMIFPRYSREEPQGLSPRRRTESFILAAYHSFNYSLLCETGFEAMKYLVDQVACYDLVYNDLEWAVDAVNSLPECRGAA